MNNVEFFASLKSQISKEGYGSIDEIVKDIRTMLAKYDSERFERMLQSLFKRYCQVLRVQGGNEFEVEHRGTAKGKKRGGN